MNAVPSCATASAALPEPAIAFELDGQPVSAHPGETLLAAAQRHGVQIPRLCHQDGLRPDGNCRACVVEIAGERTLAPSCCRTPTEGMQVQSASARARKSQQMVLEMLLSDMPATGYKWNDDDAPHAQAAGNEVPGQHGELSAWADRLGVRVRPALQALRRAQPAADTSHPAMAVNLDACIQCKRCLRACREEQVNDVIGYALRGAGSKIVFDLDDPMAESSCVACGECVQACPTGALMPKTQIGSQAVDRRVDSVCPFCGVGCLITYQIREEKIVSVQGRDGPANHGRLCVKGRFGFDYAHHPERLTRPLIRKPGVPKDWQGQTRPAHWRELFREASWDEALDLAAGQLAALRERHGPKALAGFGSAKGSNEEAYLFQKLVRTGFGSNNVDHCTRLCHASSVAALLEGVGSGAVSNPVHDVEHAELIFVIGANPTANHPVAATWMKNAARRGSRIVLADPRVTDIGRHAWRTLQFRADTDVAMLNALIHTVIEEDLVDMAFVRARVDNFDALKANAAGYSPEAVAPVCGIPAQTLREVARAFARARSAMILWGMGVSQHVHGTDNARCLIALCAITGQIGKPGSGLHPLRGQNNVQGASDAGLIPMMFPNYQRVDDPEARAWFENFWGLHPAPAGGGRPGALDATPGYTVVEIMHKALAPESDPHKVRGMYIMGENPAMSDPDLNHARHALASLEHLVVQDIFLTETAWLADVVLPASAWPEKTGTASNTDRMVQLGRRALNAPGNARPDLWIIQQIAQRMGLDWRYEGEESGVAAVYEEMRQAMHASIGGISWERLVRASSVTYPCHSADDPGQPIVFTERFPTPTGRLKLVPAQTIPAAEQPDAEYPLVLITGRQLEHWHTGSMTRRSSVLDAIEPMATASVHGDELRCRGLQPGALVRIRSRRGGVQLRLRRDDGTPHGTVFMPFAYGEAAANLLTHAALDPFGKIPEFKYCAVAIEQLDAAPSRSLSP
ncbi:formate dehydrogenase subunit alpha [Verminephrobacter aporrectodeae subsp. tuberculatae]|uniref:formate dehydrogenase subunit alpha n=1 Tax=Verminephrobacter aporrectodeae TaxID=1110389 RepID=UPI002238263F|nr:formate dehydrogenase subunit alpha [Verminephrobacter aporrectodeae]MCW5220455.1 formate dehydrogenase subunit alpha [Verminephrobacter aporrectodeae subsp. tuberculatae]MCW5289751.1 formate dehydrogenase subunit alpha [Verminephrobacter aporrectodeae subsp. tuberculatae]